jgi:hypothetical protein
MLGSRRKRWSDLDTTQKAGLAGAGVVQIALLGAALRDIARRDARELNGPRWAWVAASFVNFVGPIAYFAAGRKR